MQCKARFVCKTQDEFHVVDKVVTGYAFDIHNEYGRFCDEKIYQEIMTQKCLSVSVKAEREVELTLAYRDFRKTYRIDLLVDSGSVYEFKAVRALNNLHKQQLINYLLLTGIKHGKLLNFGSASVEYEFVSTSLSIDDRHNYSVSTEGWEKATAKCSKVQSLLVALLQEWGAFLDYRLYNEAIIHFLGNGTVCPVDIYYNRNIVGVQKMSLLDSETAFHMSAITRAFDGYEKNIKRLIKNTKIKTVQWINLNHRQIGLRTIRSC